MNAINYEALAQEFGTPLYVYDGACMTRQYANLDQALKAVPHQICFAMKANSNLAVLKLFKELGSGFDIVSEGELLRTQHIGADPKKIVFAGVAKSRSEIEAALKAGIRMLNVESGAELECIDQVAGSMGLSAPVSFRINPNIKVETHPYLATGLRSSKFGIPLEDVEALGEKVRASKNLKLVGVDCHIGSQISDLVPLREAYTEVVRQAERFRQRGLPVQYVDFGGGLGVSFSGHYEPLDVAQYGEMVAELLKGTPYEAIIEPGKYLVAEAGVLLTRVQYTKTNNENHFAIVDAGMNDLIRPSLYEAFHQVDALRGGTAIDAGEVEKVDIVGPVCETGCYLARERELPRLMSGDLILVRDAGAYGSTMSSNYNSRALPAEVLVQTSGKAHLVRKRQQLADIWRDEIV